MAQRPDPVSQEMGNDSSETSNTCREPTACYLLLQEGNPDGWGLLLQQVNPLFGWGQAEGWRTGWDGPKRAQEREQRETKEMKQRSWKWGGQGGCLGVRGAIKGEEGSGAGDTLIEGACSC